MCARLFLMTVCAVSLVALSATAEDLSISLFDAASPLDHDIQWSLADPSPTMVVGLENSSGTTDTLCGWSLGLEIVANGGTGGLRFHSVDYPSSYIFEGTSGGLTPPFSGPSAVITVIGDTTTVISGVPVPSSGKNLLQFNFDTLPNTSGLFEIRAVPDLFNGCNWFSTDFNARSYLNVPFSGPPVTLGSVNVVVPEPGTFAWLLSLSGVLAVALSFRQARKVLGRRSR